MRRTKIYIPSEVKSKIAEHVDARYKHALDGYYSANEDEDTLTGDLGASLRIKNQKVKVIDNEINGTWSWGISYSKFRGRGQNATEKMIGADGIIELEIKIGNRIERKSALFQSKKNLIKDPQLLKQAVLLTTWREAAFVLNFEPESYEVYNLDSIIKSQGKKPNHKSIKNIADFFKDDFMECFVGDTSLGYDARKRILKWKTTEGITVGTKFSIPHRIAIKVKAPIKNHRDDWYDKEIKNNEIHNYRMAASDEEILSLPDNYSLKDIKKSRNDIAKLYHPDKNSDLDDLQNEIFKRRMQEANLAYEELMKRNKNAT